MNGFIFSPHQNFSDKKSSMMSYFTKELFALTLSQDKL